MSDTASTNSSTKNNVNKEIFSFKFFIKKNLFKNLSEFYYINSKAQNRETLIGAGAHSEAEQNKFLHNTVSPKAIEQTVIVKPFDYTRKKLVVIEEISGQEIVLKSQGVELRDWNTKYITYIPRSTSGNS